MANYKLTIRADLDLEVIWEYTNLQWGKNQASKYLSQLEETFMALAKNPDAGKAEVRNRRLTFKLPVWKTRNLLPQRKKGYRDLQSPS